MTKAQNIDPVLAEYYDQVVRRLADLYVSYRKRYVMSGKDGRMFVPQRKDGEKVQLSDRILFNHLSGKYAVAIYAGDVTSKFLTMDVDVGDPVVVRQVIDAMEVIGIPKEYIYVSFSGSKGYHIDILFDQLVQTTHLRKVYAHVIYLTGLSKNAVEFRPSATQAVKLPLCIHAKTGLRCWYVDRDSLEHIESMDYVFQIQCFPAVRLEAIARELPEHNNPTKTTGVKRENCQSVYGAPMMKAGTRHNSMVDMAKACLGMKCNEDECRSELENWYHEQNQSMIKSSPAEVMRDIDGITAWTFSENFRLHGKIGARITAADAQMILAQHRKSERKILFLLMVYCATGRSEIKQNSIAYITGYSRMTVIRAMQNLEECGAIERIYGRTVYRSGRFIAERTQYKVKRPKAARKVNSVRVEPGQLKEDFDRVYCETIEKLKRGEVKADGND